MECAVVTIYSSGSRFFPSITIYAHTSTDASWGGMTRGITAGVDTNPAGHNHLHVTSSDNVLAAGTWSLVTVTYDSSLSQSQRLTIGVDGSNVTEGVGDKEGTLARHHDY